MTEVRGQRSEIRGQKSEVRGVEIKIRCAWCDQEMGSKIMEGEYLRDLPDIERVSHGICDECMEREFGTGIMEGSVEA